MNDNKNETKFYRLSLNLPADFFFRFSKMKEDNFKSGNSKLCIRDIVSHALDKYLKELGY